MSVYAIYKELFPPQTVEHVERGRFTSPDANNLIVAKASLLQIYEFVEYIPDDPVQEEPDNEESDAGTTEHEKFDKDEEQTMGYLKLKPLKKNTMDMTSARLELVAEYKLNGVVATMGVIRTSSPRGKESCDSLLLGFNDAKMSLLEWSPATHSIVTVSIHYYERDELKKEFLSNPYPPTIHIDPQQRCSILNFYDNKLAILPFRQYDNMEDAAIATTADKEGPDQPQKWPYSPSFVLHLETIDPRIKNIIDMTFLSGYYEPTLAILFQPEQTWTDRLSHAKDTVSLVVISIDLTTKVYPVIYSLDHLPYDCLKLLPMPKPVDGLLIIAANSLLHVSQGSPGVGVAVNDYARQTTSFPGMKFDSAVTQLGMVLDGARALFLGGSSCLLFLQNGDWVVAQMELDGNKVVGIDITRIQHSHSSAIDNGAANNPLAMIPSCAKNMKDGEYFFLGSRVGDSLLVKWRRNNKNEKIRSDYTFRVCDTLLNTGPIVDMSMGEMENTETDSTAKDKEVYLPDLELVTCSGHGKNGALCVFQRHIHPKTIFSFDQSDCQAIWSIKCRKEQYFEGVKVGGYQGSKTTSAASWEEQDGHWATVESHSEFHKMFDKILFISKSKRTLVLAAGDELQELVNSDFYTSGPTICVNTFFDHTSIVQVYPKGVMLLTPDGRSIQTVPIKGSRVVDASICDPYILLTLENQTLVALRGDSTTKDLISTQIPKSITDTAISTASIFTDASGIFKYVSETKRKSSALSSEKKRKAEDMASTAANKKPYSSSPKEMGSTFDEVDMDLYGDQGTDPVDAAPTPTRNETPTMETSMQEDFDDDEAMLYGASETISMVPNIASENVDEVNVSMQGELNEVARISYWCMLYTVDGTLKLYSLPDFKECFAFPRFDLLPELITDGVTRDSTGSILPTSGEAGPSFIKEIVLVNIGKENKQPHLVARTATNNIAIYKAFEFAAGAEEEGGASEGGDPDRLATRFCRIHHDYVARPVSAPNKELEVLEEELFNTEKPKSKPAKQRREKLLVPFSNVSGYAGVFVAGPQPALLMNSCKSFVRVHPVKVDGDVTGFTQFHNVNCENGFILVDSELTLRLCTIPSKDVVYDMDWIVRKVPLEQTVHKIQYHPAMRVYAVLVSSPEEVRLRNDDGAPIDGKEEEREPGEFLPTVERFSLLMVSPVTWEVVDRVDFEQYEQGFSLQCASLESKQTSTGRKDFMVVGTGYLRGEDTAMRGSIYIFEIIEVVPEPNNPQTNHRFKHLHTEDVKGAVTAMCVVSAHLVTCIGSKVIIWSFEDNESLVGVAFIDVQIYVTSMCSIKNFILLGDAQKSIWFLGFQLEPAKLTLLGKDYQSFEVASVNYLIDDKSLYLLVGDTEDNLDIYQYAPFNLQSFAGQKLMRRGDFHVGAQVKSMLRLPQIMQTEKGYEYSRRNFCLCGSFDGRISVVSPISEKTFKRLNTLYGQLVNGLQHVAGLNPRAFRLIKGPKQRMSSNRTKAVLDGNLIFEFAGLAINQQQEMTKQIGTTVARILEDLVDVDKSIDHF